MVSKLQLTLLVLVLACTLVLSSGQALGLAARHAPHPRSRARTRALRHRHRPHRRPRAIIRPLRRRRGPHPRPRARIRSLRHRHRPHRRPETTGLATAHGHRVPRRRHGHPRPRHEAAFGTRLVHYARRWLGVPYVWGGDSPSQGFDCSGLVRYVYAHFGFDLPHSSYLDYDLGVEVPRRALRPGDLVFFYGLEHVGIYVGHDRFIQAPHTGARVDIASLATPWVAEAYVGARRIVNRWGRLMRRF